MNAGHIFKSSKNSQKDVEFFVHFQSKVHRVAQPKSKWDLRTLVQSWPKAKNSNFSLDLIGGGASFFGLVVRILKHLKSFPVRNIDL